MPKTHPYKRYHYFSGYYNLYLLHQDLLFGSWVTLRDAYVSETGKTRGLLSFPQDSNPEATAFLESYVKPVRNTCIAVSEKLSTDRVVLYCTNISIFTKASWEGTGTVVSCHFKTNKKKNNYPVTLPKPKPNVWDFYRKSLDSLLKVNP